MALCWVVRAASSLVCLVCAAAASAGRPVAPLYLGDALTRPQVAYEPSSSGAQNGRYLVVAAQVADRLLRLQPFTCSAP